MSADITANRPAAGLAGRIFLDTTLNKWYRDDGTTWVDLTAVPSINGTTNEIAVTAGTSSTPAVIALASDPILPGVAGFRPPVGTTAQRSGTPTAGDTRFNSTLGKMEEFNGAVWKQQGAILQVVIGTIPAASGTTTVPLDSTLPTSTEGWQIFTVSFTPISATSKLIIQVQITSSHSAATGTNILSVFAGTTNIAAVAGRTDSVANTAVPLFINTVYVPGSTAAITFSARLGNPTSGTSYCNTIGTNTLGGSLVSDYVITEVQ